MKGSVAYRRTVLWNMLASKYTEVADTNHYNLAKKLKLSQGRVVRKPINSNPGLQVNRGINFSCIKMSFTAHVLCSFRLFKLKLKDRETIQTHQKLQIDNQNSR